MSPFLVEAETAKELVEEDAAARREVIQATQQLTSDLHTERQSLDRQHEKLEEELQAEVMSAWKEAQQYGTMTEGPWLDPETMFDDVYADPPQRHENQRRRMLEIHHDNGGNGDGGQ